ncbi:MAG: T9SS type A sorting domain-containing protein [Flavobacteriales bacterium]|nr:T9SS type A sorting domain-containing protein [Flavobacteriales bacterium]
MKKLYILLISLTVGAGVSAQNGKIKAPILTKQNTDLSVIKPTNNVSQKGITLWENDFSTASDWAITSTGTIPDQWTIETNPGLIPVSVLAPFNAATASNGYLFINSDASGGADGDGTQIITQATLTVPVDLSAEPNVVLTFSHNYRWWQDTRGVRVSGDNGANWTEYEITNNAGYPNDQNSGNPEITSYDVSATCGNSSQVLIQFYYDDNDYWAWYWAVDDVKITRKDANNVEAVTAWISGTNNGGTEYGRTPLTQVDSDWIVGAVVANDGVYDQTNISVDADFVSFSSNPTIALIEADSSYVVETNETLSLAVGLYEGTYTVTSDNDTVGGATFGDNEYLRNFEITSDIYSMDGIGIHPPAYENLVSLGTNSWTDGSFADGAILATCYTIKQTEVVSGLRVMLATGTVAGAEVTAHIMDTVQFMAGNIFAAAFYTSDLLTVSATDVANGYIDIPFVEKLGWDDVNQTSLWGNISLDPGVYYAAVEMNSLANTYDIRVVDDNSVSQPAWASAIYYPNDQSYTNGNAFAIRMLMGDSWSVGVDENTNQDISVYPNPSNGLVNIENLNNIENNIVIYDVVGKMVYSTSSSSSVVIDLTENGNGVYIIEISNVNGTNSERVVIK